MQRRVFFSFLLVQLIHFGWEVNAHHDCPTNEVFKEEGPGCVNTCKNPYAETQSCSHECVSKCFCKDGYVRKSLEGPCIKREDCSQNCPKGEIYHKLCNKEGSCDNPFPGRCEHEECTQGCFCPPGKVRNYNMTCVTLDKCPQKCSKDEQYVNCGPGCEKNCNQELPQVCHEECRSGCFCKPGFTRLSPGGACVRECPKKCGKPNEFWTCGSACEASCLIPNPAVCAHKAREGCFCKAGFVRDERGHCIDLKHCPKSCDKDTEIWMEGDGCDATCVDPFPGRCPKENRKKGCFCKPGLVRDANNKCIPLKDCPKRCGNNEVWSNCGPSCPVTCDQPQLRFCSLQCRPGCFCQYGYVRNEKGKCVQLDKCEKKCKNPNEIFEYAGHSCELTCDKPNPTPACLEKVQGGCFCKTGFVRNYEGKCIEAHKCPSKCPHGLQYLSCGTSKPATCDDPTPSCAEPCNAGCFCPPGLIKHDNNCIPKEQCPKKCHKKDEIWLACGAGCDPTCKDRRLKSCDKKCEAGCYCKAGYVRNEHKECIDVKHCPKDKNSKECGEHEKWLECGPQCREKCDADHAEHEHCRNQNKSWESSEEKRCRAGCFCKKGYLLDKHNRCVPKEECPRGPRFDFVDDD